MDASNIVAIVLGLLAALPGTLALLRQWRIDKRKEPIEDISDGIKASREAAEIIRQYGEEIKALRGELAGVRDEVESLQVQVDEQTKLINEWRAGIERLLGQIISLGQVPVWKPKTGPLKARE